MPFQDRSSTLPTPKMSVSGSASSKSRTLPPERIGCRSRSAFGRREKSTFSGAMKMCRCLEYILPGQVLDLADAEDVGVRVGFLEVQDLAARAHRLQGPG